jgi:tetratricopeptide (TPR) repeat protein
MVESEAWTQERKNVLSAVFYLGAALAYLRWLGWGRDGPKQTQGFPPWYFIALVLFIAALLSKTAVCSLPAALLLVVWWKRGRIVGGDIWPLLPFFAVGLGLGLVTSWVEQTSVGARGPEWDFSFPERCLNAGRAFWFYAAKLFWPANLTFIYPRWHFDAGAWWQWVFPVAAAMAAGVLWWGRRRAGRGPLVAVLFFGGTLLPALGFSNFYFMRYSFVADHFQYLASIGLLALVAAGMTMVWGRFKESDSWLGPVLSGGLLLVLGMQTWQQCKMYADNETLWRNTLARNPACPMAHDELGLVLDKAGKVAEAREHFEEALRLKPDFAEAHDNLGTILVSEGRVEEGITQIRQAVQDDPDYDLAHYNLGVALEQTGKFEEAVGCYEQALRLNPDSIEAHYHLASTLARLNRMPGAMAQWERILQLNPDLPEVQNNLGVALMNAGRLPEAMGHFEAAVRIKPHYAKALDKLARLLAIITPSDGGNPIRAVALAEQACELSGNQVPGYLDTLAITYAAAGRFNDAIATGEKAVTMARNAGRLQQAEEVEGRLKLYRTGQIYRPPGVAAERNKP